MNATGSELESVRHNHSSALSLEFSVQMLQMPIFDWFMMATLRPSKGRVVT